MANNIFLLFSVLLIVSSLSLIVTAEKDSSWVKNFLSSEEIADLESKERSNDDSVFASIEKRPSWVSGRDLSEYYK